MQKEKVLSFINSNEYKPMSKENIALFMQVPQNDIELFNSIINQLENEGKLIIGKKNRCFSTLKLGYVHGAFRSTTKGFGFVTNEPEDILIPFEYINGALNGDEVLVKKLKSSGGSRGEIVKIISRKKQNIVGIFYDKRTYGIIVPDDEKLPREIFVSPKDFHGALNGQKVVAEITSFESYSTSLCARVCEVLGFPYDFGVDVLSIIKRYDFNINFPQKVLDECNNTTSPSSNDLKDRLDLTKETIITIDGADTKDIDDAVCVKRTDFGYTLGVHIADVSHYVKPGSATDTEALSRGTSVYLADRVIPMLPTRLSNGLCSLNEGELRLTLSVIIDFDNDGNILKANFFKSYIKSAFKMTYDDVTAILKDAPDDLCEKYACIVPMLKDMHSLYLLLSNKTKSRGAIDFNIPEAKAIIDKNGKTVDIVLRKNTFSNSMIEEFMVAANTVVAKHLSENNVSAIYRIHENPNTQKLANALLFMYNKGYGRFTDVNSALKASKGTSGENAISSMLLRSMAKAKYHTENIGHFGLALDNYCHFTSPIRRYPDLVCHRALKAIIENDASTIAILRKSASSCAEESTEREAAAASCERDVLDLKKAEYMLPFTGDIFEGTISSVTGFGFFVELPNTVEGLVRAESLKNDYYEFDEKNYMLIGRRSGIAFTLGDSVKVKLVSADKITGKIEFIITEGGVRHGRKRKEDVSRSKQKRSSRVFHKRKNRGRH